MSHIERFFYKERVALNVLANSVENAKQIFEATEGHVLIGLLSNNYLTISEAVTSMNDYGQAIDGAVSIGLGGGDNRQATVVTEIAKHYQAPHINQVFPEVGVTRASVGNNESWINGLVSPTGKVGYVNISTGPISSAQAEQAIVPIKAAIALVRDMGGNALKYFPMKGLSCEDEYRAVAEACGEEGFALEPTGGIDKDNFERILSIALEANVPKVIPHVYSSIINQSTGATNINDVEYLFQTINRLVDNI